MLLIQFTFKIMQKIKLDFFVYITTTYFNRNFKTSKFNNRKLTKDAYLAKIKV